MRAHNIFCIHTMVGTLLGTDAMFKDNGYGGTESHYGTGGAGETIRQWQDRAFTADANLDGNPEVISVENADKGPGFAPWSGDNVPAFTDVQLEQLVELAAWECSLEAHSECPVGWTCRQGVMWNGIRVAIPPVLIPDTFPGRRGIAYHRQGIDGSLPDMRVAGGVLWSEARGKICPGDRRVAQIRTEIVPRVQARILKGSRMPSVRNIEEVTAETNSDGDVVDYDVTAGGHWPVLGVLSGPDDAFNVVIRPFAGTVQYRRNFRCFKRLADGTLAPNANATVRFVFAALG
jgi:hypothetical protein